MSGSIARDFAGEVCAVSANGTLRTFRLGTLAKFLAVALQEQRASNSSGTSRRL